ncbi:MAG: hypothetical protein ABSE69_00210 [Roseiarcus sp.]
MSAPARRASGNAQEGLGVLAPTGFSLFVGVLVMKFDMGLRGFAAMMFGLFMMSMGQMRMMGARFVLAVRDEGGGFAMMLCGLFVMLCGEFMLLGGVLGVRHGRLPFLPHLADGAR